MVNDRRALLLLAIAIAYVSGCGGGKAPAGPKTARATGKVTYKKQPVEGATVSFLGDGKTSPAMAITDSLGDFVLTTTRSGDGAVPGKHRVTVTKIVGPPTKTGPMTMEEAAKAAKEKPAKPLSMLPSRYGSADSSGLNFEVKEGQKNNFPIDLVD